MLTELFLTIATTALGWLATWLPLASVLPEWLMTLTDIFEVVLGGAAGLAAWIPWQLMGWALTAYLAIWALLFTFRSVSWLWRLTPFG